jgi:hypothetical protein
VETGVAATSPAVSFTRGAGSSESGSPIQHNLSVVVGLDRLERQRATRFIRHLERQAKVRNWPGRIAALLSTAVKPTSSTCSLIGSPPSGDVTGLASFSVVIFPLHPGTGS